MASESEHGISKRWYKDAAFGCHQNIFKDVEFLEQQQSYRQQGLQRHLGLYLDREVTSLVGAGASRSTAMYRGETDLNLNVVKSSIDTIAAYVSTARTKPMVTTSAGKFKDRIKAKKCDRWLEGLYHREKFYAQHAPHVFLDGGIFGTGVMKIAPDDGEVCMEWVWIGEILFDEVAATYAPPRVIYQRKWLPRDVVAAMWPEKRLQIEMLDKKVEAGEQDTLEDVIPVVEAWRLGNGSKDKGRHAIAVDGLTLVDEPYTSKSLPFVFWRWSMSPLGFYGVGLAEELAAIQSEINDLLVKIQSHMNIAATNYMFVPESAKVSADEFTNEGGRIIRYSGNIPPTPSTPPAMHSQVFEHLWRLRDAAYEIAGLNQLAVSASAPAGMESGRAVRALQGSQTQRFAQMHERWQEFVIECAERCLEVASEVYKGKDTGKVRWVDRGLVEEIPWSDVDMAADSYVVRTYPVNFLSTTPQGKMEDIQALIDTGVFPDDQIRAMMDWPDVQRHLDLATASFENLSRLLEEILYEGKPHHPQKGMDLPLSVRLAMHYWCLGHYEGAPQKNLDLLIEWQHAANELIQEDQPAPAPAQMPGPPAGPPMIPPPGAPPGLPPDLPPPEPGVEPALNPQEAAVAAGLPEDPAALAALLG